MGVPSTPLLAGWSPRPDGVIDYTSDYHARAVARKEAASRGHDMAEWRARGIFESAERPGHSLVLSTSTCRRCGEPLMDDVAGQTLRGLVLTIACPGAPRSR